MTFALFDAAEREPSQAIGFSGNVIDRQSEKRGEDDVKNALADPSARLMLMRGGRLLLKTGGSGFDSEFRVDEAEPFQPALDQAVLLGRNGQGPVLAVPAGIDTETLPETVKAIDYRSVNVQGLLDAAGLGALAQGAALLAWHASHGFCGKCGHRSEMRSGGYRRVCPNCSTEHFPRTDPVAIMLAVTRERCLMGRGPHFAPGMYSALAGFIEPGETIEGAVRREVFEESGIRLGRVVYHASQPWPFPYSLMIGCFGEALNEDISFDRAELEDCRWFTRAEVRAILGGDKSSGIFVPPSAAIAHHLIRAWAESD
jgi:NAD+ diphosphatase